nr:uncharacterized mitochondrial protein AtMg00810-like [Tanacetum cinerariifolium]
MDNSKRYEYEKVLSHKLSNSNRMSYSEMLDMLVYKLECEIREEANSPYLRTPPPKPRRKSIEFQGKNLYADFLHADCVDHFDALDYWNYEDVYFIGCFDVGGSRTGCDWIDEHVGYTDRSLRDISKAEFSKKALLDDGGSSSEKSLLFVLKRKGKSRVKFTRKRATLKRSKMLNLKKGVRSYNVKASIAIINAGRLMYGSLVSFIGLNEDVCDDEPQLATQLSQTGGSSDNDVKDELCKAFEKLMKDKFQMSSIEELTFFLGLQVKQKDDGIFISQDKYVAKILRKFGLTDGKSARTPIDTEKPLLKDPDGEDVDVHIYRSMICSLMYLTSSRPDIMFVVCACAQFQVTLKVSHLHAVKWIFRYLKGKPHLGLWYPKDSSFNLVAYSDNDYARASLDRKTTTRGCQFLGCRLIFWQCKKQTVVTISSTEAEYVVLINNQVDDLSFYITKYTSLVLTQKVFANMRRIGQRFLRVETPLFSTMLVQPQAAVEEDDEEDLWVLRRMHPNRGRIKAIDADEDITLVDMETEVDLDADLHGRIERKDNDNAADKEVNAVESIVFNDEEVTMTMAQPLIKMKAKKARLLDEQMAKRLHDEEVEQAMQEKHLDNIKKYQSLKRKPIFVAQAKKNMIVYLKNMAGYKTENFKGMTYDKESFKKLKAVEVSGSHSTQDTSTDDPKEMSKEDVRNILEIIPVTEFKVEALQVKYPLIDWEIHSEGSRTY